jgi:uncharacterized protein (TIGR00251 family)
MFYERLGEQVRIRIKAQPAASRNAFCGLYGEDALKIAIKAPAVEGAANKELVKFLSKRFKVPKSEIVFKSGQTSKIKTIDLPWTEQFDAFVQEIEEEANTQSRGTT